MDALKLIARIAGQRVAIHSKMVESVVEIEAITPVPLSPPHIAGLAALRSRVLTLVDSYAALELGEGPREGVLHAVVVTVDNHLYGVLVDEVEDVVELSGAPLPLHAGLARGWCHAALGLIEHDDQSVILLDAARLVAGPLAVAA